MNRDKAQNWNGYQEYAMFSNSNILRWSSKNNIFTTISGYVSIQCGIGNRYLRRGSKENVLSITITGNVTLSR